MLGKIRDDRSIKCVFQWQPVDFCKLPIDHCVDADPQLRFPAAPDQKMI